MSRKNQIRGQLLLLGVEQADLPADIKLDLIWYAISRNKRIIPDHNDLPVHGLNKPQVYRYLCDVIVPTLLNTNIHWFYLFRVGRVCAHLCLKGQKECCHYTDGYTIYYSQSDPDGKQASKPDGWLACMHARKQTSQQASSEASEQASAANFSSPAFLIHQTSISGKLA